MSVFSVSCFEFYFIFPLLFFILLLLFFSDRTLVVSRLTLSLRGCGQESCGRGQVGGSVKD